MTKRDDGDWRAWVLNNSPPTMEATSTTGTAGFTPGPANPQPFSVGFHTQPSWDVIDALPPAAQERLRMLRQRSADAHALIPEFESIREASMARIEAENALKRLTSHPQDGGFNLKPDHRRVIEAQRLLDKATADFKRLQELQTVRTAQWQAASAALAYVETWLKSGRPGGTALEDFEGPKPTLNKNETVLDAIERLRRRVRELKADLHRIASAPYPSSYAKQQMREQIEALAMQGAPVLSDVIERKDGKIIWPTQSVRSQVYNTDTPSIAVAEFDAAIPLLVWLHAETIVKRLSAEIDTEADDKAALTHEAREKAEAEVMGDLLAVEREECAVCVAGAGTRAAVRASQRHQPARAAWPAAGHGSVRRPVTWNISGACHHVRRATMNTDTRCL